MGAKLRYREKAARVWACQQADGWWLVSDDINGRGHLWSDAGFRARYELDSPGGSLNDVQGLNPQLSQGEPECRESP